MHVELDQVSQLVYVNAAGTRSSESVDMELDQVSQLVYVNAQQELDQVSQLICRSSECTAGTRSSESVGM